MLLARGLYELKKRSGPDIKQSSITVYLSCLVEFKERSLVAGRLLGCPTFTFIALIAVSTSVVTFTFSASILFNTFTRRSTWAPMTFRNSI